MSFDLYAGNCLDTLQLLDDASVDSIVTDPPYGLSFMGKKWDYDVPSGAIWRECLRVLKPGGHLLAFAGTRTQHRMAVRIEDAGFEIRDMIAWVYGSGFPKSLDVSKAIDKAAGAEREVVGRAKGAGAKDPDSFGNGHNAEYDVTLPATDAARQWHGWGTALKPALEPITVARKPLAGTVAANVLEHGTGALNIDGCRVEAEKATGWGGGGSKLYEGGLSREGGEARPAEGRWPANLIHDGSEEVLAAFPDSNGSGPARTLKRGQRQDGESWGMADAPGALRDAGTGSAARFFYCAKASRADRNEGLTDPGPQFKKGTLLSDVQAAAGELKGNTHPTVKPTDLMRYLCRLVTPPGGLVLDPFMGSGSTGKAAVLEGFRFIGCEMSPEYLAIANARIAAVLLGGLA